MIYLLHPVLFIIAVIGAVLLFSLAVANELATRKPLKAANEQNVRALRKTAAAARNAEVIEAMGMMPGITRRWLSDNQEALQQQMVASGRAGVILATSKLCRLVLQVAVDVGGQGGVRGVATAAVLVQGLHYDPVQITAQHVGERAGLGRLHLADDAQNLVQRGPAEGLRIER